MRIRSTLLSAALLALSIAPGLAMADARLTSVVPVDGGCVSGPTGPAVQAWDVEPGETYTLTINDVLECANGGTDATLPVRVNDTAVGNTDLVATFHRVAWNGRNSFGDRVPSGVYFYAIETPRESRRMKMVLLQ